MEILRLVGGVQRLNGLREEVEHWFVRHRVAQDVIENFGDEQADGLFVRIAGAVRPLRYETAGFAEGGKTGDGVVGRDLDERERHIFANRILAAEAINHIINATARACICVEDVRFVRVRLQRQYYRVSRE